MSNTSWGTYGVPLNLDSCRKKNVLFYSAMAEPHLYLIILEISFPNLYNLYF